MRITLLVAFLATCFGTLPAFAGTLGYGYNASGQLFSFDLARPAEVTTIGVPVGPDVKGIDFRPGTDTLYAIDVTSARVQLYTVNLSTGTRTPVGIGFPITGSMPGNYSLDPTASYGFDFNPTTLQMDGSIRIRFVNSQGQNLRLNSDTGQIATVDGMLAYSTAIPATSAIAGSAYLETATSRTGATAPATALYYLDTLNDTLVLSGAPNAGTFDTVGSGLGVDIDAIAGFDIFSGNSQNKAYAVVKAAAASVYSLHTVNLTVGTAGPAIGQFSAGFEPTGGFAITSAANPVLPAGTHGFSYSATGQLFSFPLNDPTMAMAIGSPVGVNVKGLDFRPGTTQLYAIDISVAGGQLFTVDPATGVRTAVGSPFPLTGMVAGMLYTLNPAASYGFDFNPATLQMDTSVRIRLVNSDGVSLRLNSDTGAIAAVDASTGYLGGNPVMADVSAASYTNSDTSRSGPTAPGTILYYIDTLNNNLVNLESNPNGGQFSAVGPLGLTVTSSAGFDIFTTGGRNVAYAVLDAGVSGNYNLFPINLITGQAEAAIGLAFPASLKPVGGLAIATIPMAAPVPDTLRPTVTIRNPRGKRLVTNRPKFLVRGNASDNTGVSRVEYRVGVRPFRQAAGTTSWRFTARLRPMANVVIVRSFDDAGNVSATDRTVLVQKQARRR